MKGRYDSFCGLYCGSCEILLMNELEKIEKKAKEWKMNLSEVKCLGCKTNQNSIYCIDCDIKICAMSKKIEFCFECNKYPCSKIQDFRNDKYPHHSIVFKNLKSIKEKGLEYWLSKQENRWKCTKCGERFTWYEKVCRKCGEKLYNCRQEEKELKI